MSKRLLRRLAAIKAERLRLEARRAATVAAGKKIAA